MDSSSTASKSNWNLEMLVFVEGGKPESLEKNLWSKDENQQQTQPMYDAGTGNRTWTTLLGGECSHHYTTPAPQRFVGCPMYQWAIKKEITCPLSKTKLKSKCLIECVTQCIV